MDTLFDGYKCIKVVREGIILIYPQGSIIPMDYKLSSDCIITNMDEYKERILGNKDAILIKVKKIKLYGYSQLVIN